MNQVTAWAGADTPHRRRCREHGAGDLSHSSPTGQPRRGTFFYFTVLSNILAAVLFAGLAVRPDWMSSNGRFRGAVTLFMVITGLVYAVLLRPIEADVGLTDQWVNWVLHSLGPAAALIDWLLFPPDRPLARSILWIWLIFPAAYLAVTLIRGPIADWYPYPFLDPSHTDGYGAVALWSLLILLFFVGVGSFLRWWANARGPQAS